MGVWAFYKTCTQEKIDYCRAGNGELFVETKPIFEYDGMGKRWFKLHEILTNGLTNPTRNNLMSNAIAGQYHLDSENDDNLIVDECWWWDFYGCGCNDKNRVKEISSILNQINFHKIIQSHKSDVHEYFIKYAIQDMLALKELYQNATDHNLGVIVCFG